MDSIRSVVKKSSPSDLVVATIRKIIAMPPRAARIALKEMTKPSKKQRRWIKKVKSPEFKGAYIGYRMKYHSRKDAEKRIKDADLVIFKIHGGGFRVGHCTMYMSAFISWLKILKQKHDINAVVVSVEYGLAPVVSYPTPSLDCLSAYKHLVETLGVPGSKIIISGDSAGGALALETLMRTYSPKMLENLDAPRTNFSVQKPAGIFLSSPLVTAETSSNSWKEFNKTDIVSYQLAKLVIKELLGGSSVNPDEVAILRLSHVQDRFDRFLPNNALVLMGDIEVMRDDISNIVTNIKNGECTNIELYSENYAHDWYFIREIVKKADKKMLFKYDEIFAEFSIKSIKEALLVPDIPPVHSVKSTSISFNSNQNSASSTSPVILSSDNNNLVNELVTPLKEKTNLYDSATPVPLAKSIATF
ncbi:Alpha/Beta hydrolase protein [Phycomyces blakesleeanus]